jgi:hypothetical protein
MKIFISWSGEKSKAIASTFKDWIPAVIQAAKPYFSPNDIEKGARWSAEIANELESSRIGLICLTADNLIAPWIMFEAGALSKSLDKARVCPMLFGIHPTDLSGPLVQFQAATFSKDEVLKFVKVVNSQLNESSLDSAVLDSVFQKWWPDLDEKIQKILAAPNPKSSKEIRTDRDLLEEVLKLTRSLTSVNIDREPSNNYLGSKDVAGRRDQLLEHCMQLVEAVLTHTVNSDIALLKALESNWNQLMNHALNHNMMTKTLLVRMANIRDTLVSRIEDYNDIPF